jgi:Asp-tRNA(Asn)/Glu-tRNA(Gln) amidotransferase A subunit family amidase
MSAADLVRAHLARIDHISHLNAFVDVRADAALAEAAAQDEAAARRVPRGVLGGLPVTVKSAIEVRGLRCETGSPSRRGRLAARDAVVVSRLRQAGAIVIGTTNVAEMLMGYDTDNPLHSLTRNPWNVAKTPGGSSGGEAAAIATGASAAGIGSDGGGSIRVPAHVSGICGFKPTPGRVPATSHQPACLGPFSLIGVVGPMARTVGDLELLDRVLSGYDPGDPMSMPLHDARQEAAAFAAKPLRRASPEPWRRRDGTRQEEVRVAFFEDDGVVPVTPETRAAVRRAARAAADAGLTVEEYRPPALADAARIWEVFFAEVALLALHEELGGGAERELPILRSYLERPPICVSVPSVAESVPSVPESV